NLIVASVMISGPAGAIFDLVTPARYWPEWHPASEAVGGVTQRPFQLGDVLLERGKVAGVSFDIAWRVVEHVRKERVVLQSDAPPARITYTFQAVEGGVQFVRELSCDDAPFRARALDLNMVRDQMHRHSQDALQRLRALVERILREEPM